MASTPTHEQMVADLRAAGWREHRRMEGHDHPSAIVWRDPSGGFHEGTYRAWRLSRQRLES